jgi:hypothetical protein
MREFQLCNAGEVNEVKGAKYETSDHCCSYMAGLQASLGPTLKIFKSRGSSVGLSAGSGLDDRGWGVRVPAGARNLSLLHRVQTDSGAHPTSYPMGRGCSFPGGKAAGA